MSPQLLPLRNELMKLSAPALMNIALELYLPSVAAMLRPHIIKLHSAELIDDVLIPNFSEQVLRQKVAERLATARQLDGMFR
jgi:hypothetical protein